MANLQKYASFEPNEAKAARADLDAHSGDLWKPKEGDNQIRIMPAPQGQKVVLVTYGHYVPVPGQENDVGFLCPKFCHNTKRFCATCRRSEELKFSNNKPDRDMGYKLAAKLRCYARIIDRANPEAGIQVFPFGTTVWDRLIAIRGDQKNGGDWADPTEDGFDIMINRKGTGMKTEYTVWPGEACDLGHEAWLTELDELVPLMAQFGQVPSDEEIREKLGGFDVAGVGAAPAVISRGGKGRAPTGAPRARRNAEDDADQS